MAITSVSLLQYPTNVKVTDNGTDMTLVNRGYVTKDIYNADPWVAGNAAGAKDYRVGELVQYNGQLYSCKQAYTVANYNSGTAANFIPSAQNSAYWERTYPVLHRYSGEADGQGVVTHNLGTKDITVQVYERSSSTPYTWTPVMVSFEFVSTDPENKIKLVGLATAPGSVYRAVIVAAR